MRMIFLMMVQAMPCIVLAGCLKASTLAEDARVPKTLPPPEAPEWGYSNCEQWRVAVVHERFDCLLAGGPDTTSFMVERFAYAWIGAGNRSGGRSFMIVDPPDYLTAIFQSIEQLDLGVQRFKSESTLIAEPGNLVTQELGTLIIERLTAQGWSREWTLPGMQTNYFAHFRSHDYARYQDRIGRLRLIEKDSD